MKAALAYGPNDVRIDKVDDPKITSPNDVIVKVTCGGNMRVRPSYLQGAFSTS